MRTATAGVIAAACVLTAGTLGPIASASAATGSTISADDGGHSITYRAGSGQANYPAVSFKGPTSGSLPEGNLIWTYNFRDRYPITPGTGCFYPDPADTKRVSCHLTEFGDFYVGLQMYLGDGVDRIDFSRADAKTGGFSGYASIRGGDGDDILTATGNEYLNGEAGNDTLTNGLAIGGDGNDTLINVDDGQGGAGNDTITGTDNLERGDQLDGGQGNDTINGMAGDDLIHGDAGTDHLYGGAGNDEIYGGTGPDTIYGNSGNDTIQGNAGSDHISGGPGIDHITP